MERHRVPAWAVALCIILLPTVTVRAAVPPQERAALEAIYNALEGPNWKDRTNWLGAAGTECTWNGVTCDASGSTVTELSVRWNNARGVLPPQIGDLANLEVFSADGSALSGTLPRQIGNLSKLRILNFSGFYDNYGSGNNLSGPIPPELGQLRNLRELYLEANNFSGPIPDAMGTMTSLEVLVLSYNPLEGSIPSSLFRLPKLRRLEMIGNKLTGSIPEVALPSLEELTMSDNALTGSIPVSIVQSRTLTHLDLEGNSLGGTIPPELNQLPSLIYLGLANNAFTSLPSLAGLTKLKVLRLHSNRLTGPVPSWIGQLRDLEVAGFGGNPMSGELPAELFTLTKLSVFYSPGTHFSGKLSEFGKLTALQYLNLYVNDFSGPFPIELTRLENLLDLDLTGNPLGGAIPPEIRLMKSLLALGLNDVGINAVPEEIGQLTQLTRLGLSGNQLTKIPPAISSLTNLEVLTLNQNRFSGPLPGSLFTPLTKLSYLNLSSNEFDGPIPPEIFSLPKITQLYLGFNRFSGAMPAVAAAQQLGVLGVEGNRLTALPPDLGAVTNLTELYLGRNEFSGPVPESVSSLTRLSRLMLGENHFSGTIPDLSKLTQLRDLVLYLNQFSGPVPEWLGSLQSLNSVLLSGNKLSGPVPRSITNLKNLDTNYGLRIGDNALYSADPDVRAFLERYDPNWEARQTVAPANVRVLAQREHSVTLGWTPIAFSSGPGGYVISVSKSATGPFEVLTTTPNKETPTFIVDSLESATKYFFSLSTMTYPYDEQQNVVTSDPGAPIEANTTTGSPAPANVAVLTYPYEIRQRSSTTGVSQYFVQNFGDLPTTVTLSQDKDFFTQSPASFILAGGETQAITLTGKLQPIGGYDGKSILSGEGVPPGLAVRVSLLVTDPPADVVTAQPSANRIDVAAKETENGGGSVVFTNVGKATLQGIVVSNVAWIIPPSGLVVIPPGESRTVAFTVDESKRPDADSPSGAVTGTLSLVYESAAFGKRGSPLDGTSVSITTPVTVVYTITPPTQSVTIPELAAGEVALFVSGVGFVAGANNRTFISDISIVNAFGVESPKDIRMYYTPSDAGQGTRVAAVAALEPSQGVTFGNVVKSVFETANQGSLQIRTRNLDQLFVNANIFNVSDNNGTFGTALPVFQSDRALRAGEAVFLTGLKRDATKATYTNMYVQETAGANASYEVDFFDAAGNSVGTKRSEGVSAFHLAVLGDAAPAGAVSARITNAAGSGGRIIAFATPVDAVSGDFWAIADWNHEFGATLSDPVVIPVAGSVQGNGAFFRTDVAITSHSAAGGSGTLVYYDRSGAVRERDVDMAQRQSLVLDDVIATSFPDLVNPLGYLEFRPRSGEFSLTSRTFATVPGLAGTFGTAVPALPRGAALRLGQSKIIAGLDVASSKTIAAKKPGTFRTNIGLVEIGGQRATIEVSVIYSDIKQVVSGVRLTTITYELGPHQSTIDGLAGRIQASNPNVSDLRNVQLKFKVTKGEGAVIVYTSSIDNGTADQILRTQ